MPTFADGDTGGPEPHKAKTTVQLHGWCAIAASRIVISGIQFLWPFRHRQRHGYFPTLAETAISCDLSSVLVP